jgi:hypothetical protein
MTIEFDELQPADDGRDDRRGRRRVIGGVAAAMLVAAAGGVGYGIGRGVDRDPAPIDAATETASETASEPASEAPTTTMAPPVTSDEMMSSDMPADMAVGGGMYGGGPMPSSGRQGYPAFGTQPMETVFERTTESGFALRAQLGQMWDGYVQDWGAGDWQPAAWCFESGQLRVSMSGNGILDVGGVPWFAEAFQGRAVSWLTLGGNDTSPQWVVVVQAPADSTNVRVVFADGSIDEVAPQNGIAVLTAPGEASTPIDEGDYTYWQDPTPSFEVTIDGGAEPVTIDSDSAGDWENPEYRTSCTPPPPPLPDAGEQPADPVAAEAEIRAAMTELYGVIGTDGEGSDLIDDPKGVAEARAQVQEGDFAESAASAVATIDELVFTAPDESWFRYSIDTDVSFFDNRYGMAVLVDGVWKITRSTVCQDLSMAGGDCGGNWQPISPPGAYPGGPYVEGDVPVTTIMLD